MQRRSHGFTLVELSIVMVVIALLISGVIGARTLIRNAEITKMISDYNLYVNAVGEFMNKYQALPGDFTRAESNWGSDTSCPTGGSTTPKRATCNGDGSGTIGTSTNGTPGSVQEHHRAWQHLANAGFIDGTYSGYTTGSTDWQPGINDPSVKGGDLAFHLSYYSSGASNTTWTFANTYGHMFSVYVSHGDPGMTAYEVEGIDQKIDDELPGTGKVRTQRDAKCMHDINDATKGYATTTDYAKADKERNCALFLFPGF